MSYFFYYLVVFFFFIWQCSQEKEKFKTLIETHPINARIFSDQKYIGNSPLLYHFPPQQKKIISIEKKNYYFFQKKILFQTNKINYRFNLIPLKKKFTLKFFPRPDLLFLNQQPTPLQRNGEAILKIPNGHYQVFSFKKNFPFLEHSFTLDDRSPSSIKIILNNSKRRNKLILKSPSDPVSIYYDQMKLGETPFTFKNLSSEPFVLNFTKKGFETKQILFSLKRREWRSVIIRLRKTPSVFPIWLEGILPNSKISIDHKTITTEENTAWVEWVPPKKKDHSLKNDSRIYPIRIETKGYYPWLGEFVQSNLSPVKMTVRLIPKIVTPTLIKKEETSEPILTARFSSEKLFLTDQKNRIIIYNKNLDLKKIYSLKTIKEKSIPALSHGFLEQGTYLLKNGMITPHRYFTGAKEGKYFFQQPTYLLESDRLVLVFNNGSHKINLWEKDLLGQGLESYRLQKTIDAYDYFEEEFLYPLRYGQAIWDREDRFYFTDPLNGLLRIYDLRSDQGSFLPLKGNRPLQPKALARYHNLIFIGEKNQIWVYLKDGTLVQQIKFQHLKEDLLFIFTWDDKIYLLTEKNIFFYQL